MTSPRICFLINSLTGGGAERAFANLIDSLGSHLKTSEIELVLLDREGVEQDLPPWVSVTTLDSRGSTVRSFFELRRHWRKSGAPAICLSYLTRSNCLNVWLQKAFGHRAIISERVQTSSHFANKTSGFVSRQLVRSTYKHARQVISVSQGVAEDLRDNYQVPLSLQTVIGNPIDGPRIRALASEETGLDLPDRFIIAMGRLVENKNFELLLKAYAAQKDAPDLVILGKGPLEERLREKAASFGLDQKVHLPGFVKNPYPVLARAEFLVSSSRAEGFPNTLVEAMTLGVPVVATDCPSGPAEILGRDSEFGILVPLDDVNRLADGIQSMMQPDCRDRYSRRARERSEHYGVDSVVSAYLSIIQEQLLNAERQRI